VQEIDASRDAGEDRGGDLGQDGGVFRHHQVLVGRAAVAEVIAELHAVGDGAAQPAEEGGDPLLVIGGTRREVAFEEEHLLADVPLDGQIVVGHAGRDATERVEEGALVGGQIAIVRAWTHVHERARHRRRQADLEADALAHHALTPQPFEEPPRIGGGFRIAGGKIHIVRIDARLEAQELGAAEQRAIPLAQLQQPRLCVHLHGRMAFEHGALPVDPAAPLPRLAVGNAAQLRW